ncbi:hypothetical protein [Rhodoplanes sp.]|uniref:hypothetical protein n=1 Tax=Rhodoplanes sp. TaxID=1968906 RepID=UPI00345B9F73
MDIDDFEDQVDRLGEDVSAWPEPSRTQALALLKASAEAREVLAEAAALRKALGPDPTVRAPESLTDRILAAAREADAVPQVGSSRAVRPPANRWRAAFAAVLGHPLRPAIVLSACFLLGLVSSLLTADQPRNEARLGLAVSVFNELQ